MSETRPEAAPSTTVRDTLLEYAERGVFRGFDHDESEPGTTAFRFSWLAGRPFRLVFDQESSTLSFERLLPAVGEESDLRADLERLLQERLDGDLPEHRKIDPERATVELRSHANGDVALDLRVRRDHYEYGVRKILNLVNEIWVRLNYAHQRYLWEELDAPME